MLGILLLLLDAQPGFQLDEYIIITTGYIRVALHRRMEGFLHLFYRYVASSQ